MPKISCLWKKIIISVSWFKLKILLEPQKEAKFWKCSHKMSHHGPATEVPNFSLGPMSVLVPTLVRCKLRFGPNFCLVPTPVWSQLRFGPNFCLVSTPIWSQFRFGANFGVPIITPRQNIIFHKTEYESEDLPIYENIVFLGNLNFVFFISDCCKIWNFVWILISILKFRIMCYLHSKQWSS